MLLVLIIVLTILTILLLVFLKESLEVVDERCNSLREFIHKNSGIFTIFFMLLFFFEQIVLLFCVYYFFKVSSTAQFLISVFALIVITTATLEKFILEKKYQYLKKKIDITTYENEGMFLEMKKLYEKYEELHRRYLKLKKES